MGCGNSKATSSVPTTENDMKVLMGQVRQTWPDVKKIDRIGTKTFAYLLNRYPEFRSFYHIPEAYKTEADLLNAPEVQRAGDAFIRLYSNIIERSEKHFDETLRQEAIELNRQGIRASQVKVYGDSLVHVIKYELKEDLTIDEKQAWQFFTNHVSSGLAIELAKFPRKSII